MRIESLSRRRWSSSRNTAGPRSVAWQRTPSNTPAPYSSPLLRTWTLASANGTNSPSIQTTSGCCSPAWSVSGIRIGLLCSGVAIGVRAGAVGGHEVVQPRVELRVGPVDGRGQEVAKHFVGPSADPGGTRVAPPLLDREVGGVAPPAEHLQTVVDGLGGGFGTTQLGGDGLVADVVARHGRGHDCEVQAVGRPHPRGGAGQAVAEGLLGDQPVAAHVPVPGIGDGEPE